MKAFKKVLTLLLVSGLMVVSIGANDVVGVGNSSSDTDLMRRGGLCVECGSTMVVREERCVPHRNSDGSFASYLAACDEHDSCYVGGVIMDRCNTTMCRACGYILSENIYSGTAHIESLEHFSNGEIDNVCPY